MAWELSNTSPAWELGTLNYVESSPSDFSIISPPATLLRGGSYSLTCENVSEAPSASTLDGQPIAVDSWDSVSIEFTVPLNTLAGHGTGKVVSFTVADVTRTFNISFGPDSGRDVVTLSDPEGDEGTIFEGMTDLDTDDPLLPVTGGQVIWSESTTPNGSEVSYPVVIGADGWPEIDAEGAVLDGTETFSFQYLLPGVAISNVVTISLRDYLAAQENSPPAWNSTPNLTELAGDTLAFNISSYASDADGDNLTFAKVSGDVGIAVSSGGIVSGTIEEPGTYPLVVSVTDGNSPPVTGTFNVVIVEVIPENNPPVWDATPLLKGDIGVAFSMDVSQYASDADNDPLTFAKTGGNSAVSVSTTGMVSGTINVGGTFPIGISVSDGKAPPVQGIFNLFIAREEVPITGEMQVAYDSTTKLVTLQPAGANAPPGSELIGGFDHTEEGDPLGYVGNHVIYHHVQDLLYKVGEYNMQAVRIIQDSDPTFPEGG